MFIYQGTFRQSFIGVTCEGGEGMEGMAHVIILSRSSASSRTQWARFLLAYLYFEVGTRHVLGLVCSVESGERVSISRVFCPF